MSPLRRKALKAKKKQLRKIEKVVDRSALALAAAPVALFQGYDSVSGAGRTMAVTGDFKTVGGTSGVSYQVCLDITELAQSLNISQSLSVSYGPIASLEQKMQFIRSLKVTTYSISIVVSARHVLGKDAATDVKLKDGITPPSTTVEIKDFVRVYGDSYLEAVSSGGEYYAVYTFYSETRQEQQSLIVELNAKGLWSGVSVNAKLQSDLSSFTSSTKTRSALNQTMSGIQNPKFPDANNIISFALSFPSLQLTAPAIINIETEGYERVPGFGDFEPIPDNRRYFVGMGVDGGLTASQLAIQELRDQILWLQDIYDLYQYIGDKELVVAAAQTKGDLAAIDEQRLGWEKDPTQTFIAPNLPSLELGTPSLNYAVSYSPAYGRNGGEPIVNFDPLTYIQQRTRLVLVQLRFDKYVDALIVGYDGNTGANKVQNGGTGGNLGTPLGLGKNQYITEVTGRADKFVDQLNITITNGNKIGGGRDGGKPFKIDIPSGAFVMGFSGRSDKYLDQVQLIFAKFSPATWQPPST